jgi:hypothetical protein
MVVPMTGRGPRTIVVASAVSVALAVAAAAARADDPSAYTDPAPAPIQDQQAAKKVGRALREQGIRSDVKPEQVRVGIVVAPTTTEPSPDTGGPSGASTPAPAPQLVPASDVELTAAGRVPSERAGVDLPSDSQPPDLLLLLIAAGVVAVAGSVSLARR